jgi:CRP/FNR family cyclic AMP-dependent transcriptional regulator
MNVTQTNPARKRTGMATMSTLRRDADVSGLRDKMGARSYNAGDTIFGPADGSDRLYIVRQGWVRVYKSLPDGRAITFALLGPNSIVTQEYKGTSGATAEAFVDCVVTEADLASVVDLIARAPQLATAIISGLQKRISQLHEVIEQLLIRDTAMRLAGTLLMLEDAFGEETEDAGYSRITTTVTHQFLANMIGSNRVTVTRKLLDLQSDNLIKSLGRNSIAINVEGLRSYLDEKEAKLGAREEDAGPPEA